MADIRFSTKKMLLRYASFVTDLEEFRPEKSATEAFLIEIDPG